MCLSLASSWADANGFTHRCSTLSDVCACSAQVMDLEDLARLGASASGPCPYFLSREMAATADIVFMPVRNHTCPPTALSAMAYARDVTHRLKTCAYR